MPIQSVLNTAVAKAYQPTNFRGLDGHFVNKSQNEIISDVYQQLGWKRSFGLIVEFALSLFGYRTSKEDQIVKAMREYKITTLNALFTSFDTLSKDQNKQVNGLQKINNIIAQLQQEFPQFTTREIYLLISQKESCQKILVERIYEWTHR